MLIILGAGPADQGTWTASARQCIWNQQPAVAKAKDGLEALLTPSMWLVGDSRTTSSRFSSADLTRLDLLRDVTAKTCNHGVLFTKLSSSGNQMESTFIPSLFDPHFSKGLGPALA